MDGRALATMFKALVQTTGVTKAERGKAISYIFQDFLGVPPDEWSTPAIPADLQPANHVITETKPRSSPHGRILATKGTACLCSSCKQVAHRVVADVYAEGMSGAEFLACFDPEPKAPLDLLTDEYGNELVNCRLCGGEKTVVFLSRNNEVK